MNLAAWLIWMTSHTALHADAWSLDAAARWHQVPELMMEAIAATESGFGGRNDVLGAHGEIGRMQIQVATARKAHCPEPVAQRLHEHGYNIACGARILRACYEHERSWARVPLCYNAPAHPDQALPYLAMVERQAGRIALSRLR